MTEQLLAARPDVTMGGGAETFAQTATGGEYHGKTLEAQAKERGFQIIRTADELTNVSKADQDAPLLGLFADGNMPVTADNADMTISYGTSEDVDVEDQTHTGTQVRIAAYGPRAANVVGLTDQTDLFFTMTDALGIKR